MGNASENQWLINHLDYPPTHQYELETLKPLGVLEERERLILKSFPTFYESSSFLDIGANKGFFSKKFVGLGARVKSVEPDNQFHNLLEKILPPNILFKGTFGSFTPDEKFQIAWVGNVHHYLEKESPNLNWLKKLHALVTDAVIIEGPIETCLDIPKDLRNRLSVEKIEEGVSHLFDLVYLGPSVSYTPGRAMYVLRKKNIPTKVIDEIPANSPEERFRIKKSENLIFKYPYKRAPLTEKQEIAVEIANNSDHNASRIQYWICNSQNLSIIGWSEGVLNSALNQLDIENGKIPPRNLSKVEFDFLFIAQLIRQIDLVKIGYIDDDFGHENWTKVGNQWKIFDKNSIYSISELDTERIQNILQVFKRVYGGTAYEELEKSLVSSLSTKDRSKIISWLEFALEIAIKNSEIQSNVIKKYLHNVQSRTLDWIYGSKVLKSILKSILPNKIKRRLILKKFY